MVTAQSMHYYSVSANLRIHILLAVSYFNRQRLCAKSAAKLRQKNETAKCRLIFNVVFYPALCSSLCRVCRKIMYIQYRQRLTDLINSNSFYVLSTSFLRLFYVIGTMMQAKCINCIFPVYQRGIYNFSPRWRASENWNSNPPPSRLSAVMVPPWN